jgi:hypothetical protein
VDLLDHLNEGHDFAGRQLVETQANRGVLFHCQLSVIIEGSDQVSPWGQSAQLVR